MIRFFRHIRQGLFIENRLSKYLLYAIGEIFLVVAGILIALQINEWNEERKARNVTKIYVANLIEDLRKDTSMYSDQIKAALIKNQFCKEIHGIIFENISLNDSAAFIVHLQAAGRLILPTLTDNTYKDLVSTGNLKLIKDKESIDKIREYYSNPLQWWYEDYKDQLVHGYLPIVVDAIPMDIHERILANETLDAYQDFTDKALLNNTLDHYSTVDVDHIFQNLKGSEDFRFQLKRITRSHLVQIKILSLSNKSAIKLLQTLEKWLIKNKL